MFYRVKVLLLYTPIFKKYVVNVYIFCCVQLLVNEMEKTELSLKEMKEVESILRNQPIPGVHTWAKSRLVDCQTQWDKLSKQVS